MGPSVRPAVVLSSRAERSAAEGSAVVYLKLGDEQIIALWDWTRALKDSYDDMNFTPPSLSRITAPTLIVYGDRDPLYPVEMAVDMYRAIPRSALWIVPNGAHGPIFFDAVLQFVQTALAFFRTQHGAPRPQDAVTPGT